MNQAAHALHQVTVSLDFVKEILPLEPYAGLESPPQLVYQDQIEWIANHARNNIPSSFVLSQAKASTWQQMLANIEIINRLRHPSVDEAYIQWRSQKMLVRRLWPDTKFPGVDPDEVYTQVRRKYCIAAKKLVFDKEQYSLDDSGALIYLNETYNKKLTTARKAKAKQSKEAARKIDEEDAFVIVEMDVGDEEKCD
ncbi:predicted protein [Sclerotinia sclerotiorum 1980 UF-70]|uniref:Uncharacterized protein n=2 Tax=Sclerotinia sclerotiorum (strain ATCC 18683 / 1980 / Ss-1) TaxID=665079 RepID=A7EWD2_SCLS1|nr:predicted protein [Sclerotinia sclerotiorum 1980 UF-70]APA05257.1 hypothetical protein sscle_01g000270 [Sclerotinia sclerotiorum 1980 UF-70]EDN93774.1 predicted protein [Sclerotinia sclerotiorum 1980 UF-70]